MRHNDFMNDRVFRIDGKWEGCRALPIQEDCSPTADVALRTVCRSHLAIDDVSFPAIPNDPWVLIWRFRKLVLTVEEDKHVVIENRKQIT